MGICVYKIKFKKSSYDLNVEYEKLSEYEKERISELEAQGLFDFNDENLNFNMYIISSNLEIKKYVDVLNSNLIDYKISDISKDIISNKIDLESELLVYIDKTNRKKYKDFIEDVSDWISKSLDIDTILDRISEVGINSLRDVEKDFLKRYKPVIK